MPNLLEDPPIGQPSEHHILQSLLTFLQFKDQDLGHIDIDAPIGTLDEVRFLLAVSLFETHYDFNIPELILENKNKSLRQLADEIRAIPKLHDAAFFKKHTLGIVGRNSEAGRN